MTITCKTKNGKEDYIRYDVTRENMYTVVPVHTQRDRTWYFRCDEPICYV